MIINVNALKEFKDNNFEEEISFDEESYKYSFPIVKINHCLAKAKAKLLGEVVEVKLDINMFLTRYYDTYTGLYLKSKNFLNKMLELK